MSYDRIEVRMSGMAVSYELSKVMSRCLRYRQDL
jgi:hypothetical protein